MAVMITMVLKTNLYRLSIVQGIYCHPLPTNTVWTLRAKGIDRLCMCAVLVGTKTANYYRVHSEIVMERFASNTAMVVASGQQMLALRKSISINGYAVRTAAASGIVESIIFRSWLVRANGASMVPTLRKVNVESHFFDQKSNSRCARIMLRYVEGVCLVRATNYHMRKTTPVL